LEYILRNTVLDTIVDLKDCGTKSGNIAHGIKWGKTGEDSELYRKIKRRRAK
jgi:hypothetical protein